MRGGLHNLTEEQRAEIARRGREGEFCSVIAKEYGVSPNYVSKIVNRWRPKADYGRCGGLATAHTTPAQHKADLEEVRRYMACYRDASVRDVALECNMSNGQAERLMAKVKGK